MDNLVYEESLNTEVEHSEFINKKWIYVNDNNNGSYSSQIVLDSTSLSNSGSYIGWNESFILMPLVVQLTGAIANLPLDSNVADHSWAFKSGFWHMIDSMTVEFNNQNVIQTTPFSNVFRSFKANTTFSCDDIKNHGSSTGFFPDTAGSWSYNTTATTNEFSGRGGACGIANNANGVLRTITTTATNGGAITKLYVDNDVMGSLSPGALVGTGAPNPSVLGESSYAVNQGMKKRQEWVGYSANALATGTSELNQIAVNSGATSQSLFRPVKTNNTNATLGSVVWLVYAKLRLKDLADFFEKVPLLKGSTIRFLINTNQSITNFTITAGAVSAVGVITQPVLTVNSSTVTGGRTCPLMLASASYGSGCCTLGAGDYNISCSVFKNNFPAQSTASNLTASIPCRLYAPAYTMNPLAESKYLSLAPTKRILYKDIFQYQYTNVGAGQNFNFLASNGINRIRSVLVVPFINTTTTGGIANINTNINSFTTPCSPTPAMPDPIMLSNFNILISGMNLFISNTLYDFESFREHLMSANQLNGNLTTGLTSGQISEDDFSRGYRYYFGDCSRALPSEENVSRSVQVIGKNESLVPCDIFVFVEFMKEITIDLTTGARID
jgi:hypothetical protein